MRVAEQGGKRPVQHVSRGGELPDGVLHGAALRHERCPVRIAGREADNPLAQSRKSIGSLLQIAQSHIYGCIRQVQPRGRRGPRRPTDRRRVLLRLCRRLDGQALDRCARVGAERVLTETGDDVLFGAGLGVLDQGSDTRRGLAELLGATPAPRPASNVSCAA